MNPSVLPTRWPVTLGARLGLATVLAVGCAPPDQNALEITTPSHGDFVEATVVTVQGVSHYDPTDFVLEVNGVTTPYESGVPWLQSIDLDHEAVFNTIVARTAPESLSAVPDASMDRERVVVIAGEALPDDEFAPKSVGLRLNETLFANLQPLLSSIGNIDLGQLLPQKLIDDREVAPNIEIDVLLSKSPIVRDLRVGFDSEPGQLVATIDVIGLEVNLRVDVEVDFFIGSHEFQCAIELEADTISLSAPLSFQPDATGVLPVDVVQTADAALNLDNFEIDFKDDGICDSFILEAIVDALTPRLRDVAETEIPEVINERDATGRTMLEAGIEDGLAEFDVGNSLRRFMDANLLVPASLIDEDHEGVSLALDSKMEATCPKDPTESPLPGSYIVRQPFPVLGATTPTANLPFDLAAVVSTSVLNQTLKNLTECGMLTHSLYRIGQEQITAGRLAQDLPSFGAMEPSTPFGLEIRPTVAPVITGQPGPNGELVDVRLGDVHVGLHSVESNGEELVGIAMDVRIGLGIEFDDEAKTFHVTVSQTFPEHQSIEILKNELGLDVAELKSGLPPLFSDFITELTGSFDAVSVPGPFNIADLVDVLEGVEGLPTVSIVVPEVSRIGEYIGVFFRVETGSP